MTSPATRPLSGQEGSDFSNNGYEGSDVRSPEKSAQHEAERSEIIPPAKLDTGKDQLLAMIASLRSPADGDCIDDVGSDGVYRVLRYLPTPPDEPTGFEVYDAKPMSPEMIKAFLDTRPWSQAVEDRFRGADGRTVPQEQWWNPPPGIIRPMRSKNERDEDIRKYREEKMQLEEKVARGDITQEEPVACDMIQSDYDLRPR